MSKSFHVSFDPQNPEAGWKSSHVHEVHDVVSMKLQAANAEAAIIHANVVHDLVKTLSGARKDLFIDFCELGQEGGQQYMSHESESDDLRWLERAGLIELVSCENGFLARAVYSYPVAAVEAA